MVQWITFNLRLNNMTQPKDCEHRGGGGEIPPRLYLTIAGMSLTSLVFLITAFRKGWLHYEFTTPIMMHGSHTTSTMKLGFYRIFCFVYTFATLMAAVAFHDNEGHLAWDLRYFTSWNYVTFILVFGLLSVQHIFTYTPQWLSKLTWSLYQVELVNVFFLDIVFWCILFPSTGARHKFPEFWFTINVHLINAILMGGEMYLGRLLVLPGQIAWVAVYAMAYVIFSFINYSATTSCMPYAFMAVSPVYAPAIYIGMFVMIAALFGTLYKIVQYRERSFGGGDILPHTGYTPIQ